MIKKAYFGRRPIAKMAVIAIMATTFGCTETEGGEPVATPSPTQGVGSAIGTTLPDGTGTVEATLPPSPETPSVALSPTVPPIGTTTLLTPAATMPVATTSPIATGEVSTPEGTSPPGSAYGPEVYIPPTVMQAGEPGLLVITWDGFDGERELTAYPDWGDGIPGVVQELGATPSGEAELTHTYNGTGEHVVVIEVCYADTDDCATGVTVVTVVG